MEARKLCAFRTFAALLVLSAIQLQSSIALAGSTNGAAGQMPAFYEGQLFTVNMKEMPGGASAALIGNTNPGVNKIYASNDLDEEQDFVPVINAIQGEEFNPLWLQFLISFNAGFAPHQFVSEDQILNAAATGEIHLEVTDEVYRCSVLGMKRISGLGGL